MRSIVALLLFSLWSAAYADTWLPAVARGVASPSGNIVVRVLPGDNLGEVFGFSGEKKGHPAQAVYYRLSDGDKYVQYQQVALLNPIAPVDFVVSDSGELATLDNWHNVGIGKALVVYAPDGSVRRSYELKDIYTLAEIEKIDQSVSSVWWRCNFPPIFEPRTSSLTFYDSIGNVVAVDLKTGNLTKPTSHKGC